MLATTKANSKIGPVPFNDQRTKASRVSGGGVSAGLNGSIRLRRERSDKTDTFNRGNNGADFGAKIVKENAVGGVASP